MRKERRCAGEPHGRNHGTTSWPADARGGDRVSHRAPNVTVASPCRHRHIDRQPLSPCCLEIARAPNSLMVGVARALRTEDNGSTALHRRCRMHHGSEPHMRCAHGRLRIEIPRRPRSHDQGELEPDNVPVNSASISESGHARMRFLYVFSFCRTCFGARDRFHVVVE